MGVVPGQGQEEGLELGRQEEGGWWVSSSLVALIAGDVPLAGAFPHSRGTPSERRAALEASEGHCCGGLDGCRRWHEGAGV